MVGVYFSRLFAPFSTLFALKGSPLDRVLQTSRTLTRSGRGSSLGDGPERSGRRPPDPVQGAPLPSGAPLELGTGPHITSIMRHHALGAQRLAVRAPTTPTGRACPRDRRTGPPPTGAPMPSDPRGSASARAPRVPPRPGAPTGRSEAPTEPLRGDPAPAAHLGTNGCDAQNFSGSKNPPYQNARGEFYPVVGVPARACPSPRIRRRTRTLQGKGYFLLTTPPTLVRVLRLNGVRVMSAKAASTANPMQPSQGPPRTPIYPREGIPRHGESLHH